ncbi:MAG: putative Ig domain-containing protein, partial [Planctomycetota bacterium]
ADVYSLLSDATKGTIVEAHPIIAGVNVFNAGFIRRTVPTVIIGARSLLRYSDNNVCVAVKESFPGRIFAVNTFPWTTAIDSRGWNPANNDVDLCIAQALVWVANLSPKIQTPAAGALADGYLSTAYNVTVTASGGATPYTWSISAGALPTGLTINSTTGVISGTPTAAGTYNFTVQVSDNNAKTDTRAYSIVVYALPTITSPAAGALAAAVLNQAYGPIAFSSTGGKAALVWSISAGALPTGISQNTTTGALSGTPTVNGVYNFTARVTDANGKFDTRAYSITVTDTPVISPNDGAITPEAYVGASYSFTFTATGGTPAYTWSVFSGSLPAGLSLNTSTGALTGTPSAAGNSTFAIRVTDSGAKTDTNNYTLLVLDMPSITSPAAGALPAATRNAPNWSQAFTATGGKTPYAWSQTGLPAGLSINASTGTMSGTPTAAGAFNITVTLTDANGKTDAKLYTLTVNAALSITTTAMPDAEEGNAYSQPVATSGGTAPFAWSMLITPSLPDLSINASTGVISGTPSAGTGGNYSVNVTVTDTWGGTANKVVTLAVTLPTGGKAANCGCTTSATSTDRAFGGWLLLLLPMMLMLARRRQ